jgi:hypothetical protein
MLSRMSSGWHVKVARARELVDELRVDLAAFVDSRPYELTERDAGGVVTYELRLAESPPQRLSVIAGEVAHDLRSALDHLAWHLVEANGERPSRDTAFPVQRAADENAFAQQTRGMSNSVVAAVRHAQPYASAAPHQDPLLRLHDFNRFDKHRLVHVVAIAMQQIHLTIGGRQGTGQIRLPWDARWGWPVFDGVLGGQAIGFDDATHELVVYIPAPDRIVCLLLPLVRQRAVLDQPIRFSAPRARRGGDSTVEVYADVQLDVVFAEEGTEISVIDLLGEFVQVTQRVIERVEAASG